MRLFISLTLAMRLALRMARLKDGEYYRISHRLEIEPTNFGNLMYCVMLSNIMDNKPGVHRIKNRYIFIGTGILGDKWLVICRPSKQNKEEQEFFESIK